MKTSDESGQQSSDAVEQLLARAQPRPAPPPDVTAAARLAIRAEWQQANRRRNVQRYALAASVLLAAVAWFAISTTPETQVVQVATIDKASGEFGYLLENGVIEYRGQEPAVYSGETVITGDNATLGLAWASGGSLRLDVNTSVRFLDGDEIELRSGRVYFDSRSMGRGPALLLMHTDYGDLRNLGTQFMADVRTSDLLRVSVREGEVAIAGIHHDARAEEGTQVILHGDRDPAVMNIAAYSAEWRWVENVAPAIDTNGKSFRELLEWVSRETGLPYRFATPAAEQAARKPLTGVEGDEPMRLLRVGAAAAQLVVEQQDGEILISQKGP